ncbi:MAG: hypothetical protein EA423_03125 [Phycisphaerales bacterium]|nr:MAG: hypothetical protein EA423_03125 [Phycisphaerales bacterium]
MSAIDAQAAFALPPTNTGKDGLGALGSGEFLQIILSELSRQDPLAPSDTSALLDQIATVRSIQSDVDLSDRLGELVKQNELSAASGLIGGVVGGVSTNNERAVGIVLSVSRTKDGAVLNLDTGQRVNFKQVDEVVNRPTLREALNGSNGSGDQP